MGTYSYSGTVQKVTVKTTGVYDIVAYGAQGAASGNPGGKGAEEGGDFALTAGETLRIVVGGAGRTPRYSGNGGGGGTFVFVNNGSGTYVPLLVAGGGGGAAANGAGGAGTTEASGSGYGGVPLHKSSGHYVGSNSGAGGAGVKGSGQGAVGYGGFSGPTYQGGYAPGYGGFGGGGSGADGGFGGGGGGGGFSGGNGGAGGNYGIYLGPGDPGTGGTSYRATTADDDHTVSVDGENAGDGKLVITPNAVCYAAGTLIRTVRGDVAVEALAVGDRVVTASGAERPIKWLGHRAVDCAAHPAPRTVWPVRIARDAFGANKPSRDLHVSPGHALCVDVAGAVLIPASALVNGSTVTQVPMDAVTYWHVELDSHDVLLANGLPAESYLDTGNRAFFAANGAAHPDAAPHTRADVCHPFHHRGPLVEAVRLQLAARAAMLGWTADRDADLRLVVDGKAVRPFGAGDTALFLFPASARDVRLVSNTFVPTDCGGSDTRRLGIRLHGLSVSGSQGAPRRVALDDPALVDQVHASERDTGRAWRWTRDHLVLAPALWSGLVGDIVLNLGYGAATVRGYRSSTEAAPHNVPSAMLRAVA